MSCTKCFPFSQILSKLAPNFLAIELLTFFINSKFHFHCSRDLSVLGINKIYPLSKQGSHLKNVLNIHQNSYGDHINFFEQSSKSIFHIFRFFDLFHLLLFIIFSVLLLFCTTGKEVGIFTNIVDLKYVLQN